MATGTSATGCLKRLGLKKDATIDVPSKGTPPADGGKVVDPDELELDVEVPGTMPWEDPLAEVTRPPDGRQDYGVYGLLMEGEDYRSYVLAVAQTSVAAIAVLGMTFVIPFEKGLQEKISNSTLSSTLVVFIRFCIVFVMMLCVWPMFHVNHAQRTWVRAASLAYGAAVSGAAFYVMVFEYLGGPPFSSVGWTMVIATGIAVVVSLVCMFREGVLKRPERNLYSGEMMDAKRSHVRWLCSNLLKPDKERRLLKEFPVECYDGTIHNTADSLLEHMRTKFHLNDVELMEMPLSRWTKRHVNRACESVGPKVTWKLMATTGLTDALKEYFMPKRPGSARHLKVFRTPAVITFVSALQLVIIISLSALLFRNVPKYAKMLEKEGDKVETCEGGDSDCHWVVSVAGEPKALGFYDAVSFLGVGQQLNSTGKITDLDPDPPSARAAAVVLNATISAYEQMTGKKFRRMGGDLYPGDYGFTRNVSAITMMAPQLRRDIWVKDMVNVIHTLSEMWETPQYALAFGLFAPNSTEAEKLVSEHREKFHDALETAYKDTRECVDVLLTLRYGKKKTGQCAPRCGRLPAVGRSGRIYMGSCLMYHDLKRPIIGSSMTGVSVASLFALLSVYQTWAGYRQKVLQIRLGKAKFPYAPVSYPAQNTVYLVGAVTACLLFGYLLVALLLIVVFFLLLWRPTIQLIWEIRSVWLAWIIPTIVLMAWQYPIFAAVVDKSSGHVKNSRWFSVLNKAMMFVYMPQATLQGIMRVAYLLIMVAVGIMRCDFSLFPETLRGYDKCYAALIATAMIAEPNANPTVSVFVDLLLRSKLEVAKLSPKSRRLRNRWHLVLLLHAQPWLIQTRNRLPPQKEEKKKGLLRSVTKKLTNEASKGMCGMCVKKGKKEDESDGDYEDAMDEEELEQAENARLRRTQELQQEAAAAAAATQAAGLGSASTKQQPPNQQMQVHDNGFYDDAIDEVFHESDYERL